MTNPGDTERRLVAIFAADVEGYSRLMGADEVGTLKDLTQRRDILDGLIASRRGRIANTAGDSVLAEFGSAVDAVQCAVEAQAALSEANAGLSPDRHINFRIGVHVGDVMIKGGDLFGDGVNIAARLQTLASAGGVCLSGVAYDQVRKVLPFSFADLGAQRVKNIDEPVRAFSVVAERAAAVAASENTSVPLALPDKPSIAVLPFQNMSGDPEQEYFADGMVEDIITALSRFKSLFVIARNSSFTYKGKSIDIKQVGRELGVRYVLEGSVRKLEKRIRITGQLIDAITGVHIWADRLDREISDIFALQDEVTQSVVSAIEPSLLSAEIARKHSVPTNNLDAYDLYLRGVSEANQITEEHLRRAELFLRQAVQSDPYYSDAWAALADTLGRQIIYGYRTDIVVLESEARNAALKAVELDPNNGMALGIAAWCLAVLSGSVVEAVELAHRAMSAHPNSSVIRGWCGWTFVYGGEFAQAIETLNPVYRISPFDPRLFQIKAGIIAALFFQKNFNESEQLARETLARFPSLPVVPRYLAASLFQLDRIQDAKKVIDQIKAAHPSISLSTLKRINFRHAWMVELYIGALRKAGYPE